MLSLTRFLLTLTGFLLLSQQAIAIEIYTFVTKDCRVEQGLLINIKDENLSVLSLTGKSAQIAQKDIEFLIIHNTVENPITQLNLDENSKENLREIYLGDTEKPDFVGWAIKFVEDLVIFYDLTGKVHVLEIYNIAKIRPAQVKNAESFHLSGVHEQIHLGDVASRCPELAQSNSGLRPSRILGDKIQIEEFISNYEKGFRSLAGYQERTYLYARPFLYEKSPRLGFAFGGEYVEAPKPILPIFYQWSTGKPYRFQSFTQVGAVPVEWLPTVQPTFAIRSEVKSHIFHATFVGHVPSLSAGNGYFLNALPHSDGGKLDTSGTSLHFKNSENAFTGSAYNYMALMGADWGPWSFSVGYFYPIYMIWVRGQYREVLASSFSPVARVIYTKKNWRLRAIYSQSSSKANDGVDNRQINAGNDSAQDILSQFELTTQFFRAGFDWNPTDELSFGIDQVFLNGRYHETTQPTAFRNKMNFNHLTTSAYVGHQFGDYISVKAYANFFRTDEDYKFSNVSDKETDSFVNYGGIFEFIF
jgi:hypothetical protein